MTAHADICSRLVEISQGNETRIAHIYKRCAEAAALLQQMAGELAERSDYKEKYLLLSAQHVRELDQAESQLADLRAELIIQNNANELLNQSSCETEAELNRLRLSLAIAEEEIIQVKKDNGIFGMGT